VPRVRADLGGGSGEGEEIKNFARKFSIILKEVQESNRAKDDKKRIQT